MKILHSAETDRKTAVVTGATSGIGRDIARLLSERGYHLIITGRNSGELMRLVGEFGEKRTTAVCADLTDKNDCFMLHRLSRRYNTEVLINNAGLGVHGEFAKVSLSHEMEMLDLNVRAVHILMKLFIRDFIRFGRGYVLNVASSAGFMPGPFMSGYYASKSYVITQTVSVYEELRRKHRNVHISLLCPGPVNTDFNRRAGVSGSFSGISSAEAAREAVEGLFGGKLFIIPTSKMKILCTASRMLPMRLSAFVNYYVQGRKKPLD